MMKDTSSKGDVYFKGQFSWRSNEAWYSWYRVLSDAVHRSECNLSCHHICTFTNWKSVCFNKMCMWRLGCRNFKDFIFWQDACVFSLDSRLFYSFWGSCQLDPLVSIINGQHESPLKLQPKKINHRNNNFLYKFLTLSLPVTAVYLYLF